MEYRLNQTEGRVELYAGDELLGGFESKMAAVEAVVERMLAPQYHEYPEEFHEAAALSDRMFPASSFKRNQLFRLQNDARIRKTAPFRKDLERVVAWRLKEIERAEVMGSDIAL